jgi:uncharacterized protein (UPF0332 family)
LNGAPPNFHQIFVPQSLIASKKGISSVTFLEKAKENLSAAKLCFEKGHFNACANRAYYSALHAAISALAHHGIQRKRIDHGQVQADFSGELINRRKLYPARLRSYLSDMQFVRDKADYTDGNVSRKMARRMLSKPEEMIRHIGEEIEK